VGEIDEPCHRDKKSAALAAAFAHFPLQIKSPGDKPKTGKAKA
jgi:hypothetical protein